MSNRERGPRFEAAFAELVQGLGSESDDEAVAAMLLELKSFPVFPPNDDAFYETVIPQPLLERPLEPSEEELLVTELHRLVRSSIHGEVHLPKTPGLIYALGNANPWVGGSRILDILVRHTDGWSCRSSTKRCTLLRGACPVSKPTTRAIPTSRNRCVEPTRRQRSSASLPPS